jgi:hypothetical protein
MGTHDLGATWSLVVAAATVTAVAAIEQRSLAGLGRGS